MRRNTRDSAKPPEAPAWPSKRVGGKVRRAPRELIKRTYIDSRLTDALIFRKMLSVPGRGKRTAARTWRTPDSGVGEQSGRALAGLGAGIVMTEGDS